MTGVGFSSPHVQYGKCDIRLRIIFLAESGQGVKGKAAEIWVRVDDETEDGVQGRCSAEFEENVRNLICPLAAACGALNRGIHPGLPCRFRIIDGLGCEFPRRVREMPLCLPAAPHLHRDLAPQSCRALSEPPSREPVLEHFGSDGERRSSLASERLVNPRIDVSPAVG